MDPYRTIWFAPKRTFENFFQDEKKHPVYFLPILIMGVSFAISQTSEIGNLFGEDSSVWTSLIMMPLSIGIVYLVFGLVLPSLTRLFGIIWKGQASMRQMVNVYSISLIPYAILLIYQIILFVSGNEPTRYNVNAGIDYILRLWSFVLIIIGVAKIQRFSYGMSLLNVLITYLPFIIIALLLRG